MSMFPEIGEVVIPKTLKECCKIDKVSQNLRRWSENIEVWGKRVCIIIICLGLFISFLGSKEKYEDLDLALFLISMVTWIIYAGLTKLVCKITALVILAYATIVQNTTVSANVALYNASKSKEVTAESTLTQNIIRTDDGGWICKKCETKNSNATIYCKNCGEYR